ncbi:MAG: hypothetical protein ACRYGA_02125 [Janthinobacterium lividum]
MDTVLEKPISTAIAEYSTTAAALAELKSRLHNVAYDVSTGKGLDVAKKDRAEVRLLRTSLEKKRVELKAPALERSRLIDAEAKALTAELEALEKPIDDQIKAEERRKEVEKAAREQAERQAAAAIQVRIDAIRAFAMIPAGVKAASIQVSIDNLKVIEVTLEAFGERGGEAAQAKAQTLGRLDEMLDGAREFEAEQARLVAEREELARQRAEQEQREKAERERVAAEQKAQAERLAAERAAFEKEQAAARAEAKKRDDADRARRDEEDRLAREARAAEDKRVADARAALETEQRAARAVEEAKAAAARKIEQDRADAEAAIERKRLDDEAAERRTERQRIAEEARMEQQRKGEERERLEAARLKVRDAAPALLAAAQQALAECVDLIATPAGDALAAAIELATGKAA